jgi:hypothetical protein
MEAVYRRTFDIHPIEDFVDRTPHRGLTEEGSDGKNAFDLRQLEP